MLKGHPKNKDRAHLHIIWSGKINTNTITQTKKSQLKYKWFFLKKWTIIVVQYSKVKINSNLGYSLVFLSKLNNLILNYNDVFYNYLFIYTYIFFFDWTKCK